MYSRQFFFKLHWENRIWTLCIGRVADKHFTPKSGGHLVSNKSRWGILSFHTLTRNQLPRGSLLVGFPVSSCSVEDLVVVVDTPNSCISDRDTLQTSVDVLPSCYRCYEKQQNGGSIATVGAKILWMVCPVDTLPTRQFAPRWSCVRAKFDSTYHK